MRHAAVACLGEHVADVHGLELRWQHLTQGREGVRGQSVEPILPRHHASVALSVDDAASRLLKRLGALRLLRRDVTLGDEPRELAPRDRLVLRVERAAHAHALAFDGRVEAAVPPAPFLHEELAVLLLRHPLRPSQAAPPCGRSRVGVHRSASVLPLGACRPLAESVEGAQLAARPRP